MDISAKIDDPLIVDVLTNVSAVAAHIGIPFFTVGAMARDLVLWYGFGVKPGRATRDVDLAFSVSRSRIDVRWRLASCGEECCK